MNDRTTGLHQIDEEILDNDVSDEALETAAGNSKVENFTISFCSGLSTCPA